MARRFNSLIPSLKQTLKTSSSSFVSFEKTNGQHYQFNRTTNVWRQRAALGLACMTVGFGGLAFMEEKKHGGLDPKTWQKFKVAEVLPYNWNTKIIVFQLDDAQQKLDLPITSFILTKANIDGKDVVRPYTPIDQHVPGKLYLLVKRYESGNMSKYLTDKKPGDYVELQGPLLKLKYEPKKYSHVALLMGGSGITPGLQLMEHVFRNKEDKTKVTLIYGNATPDDILLKERLDAFQKDPRFKIIYTVDKPTKNWQGEQGVINAQMLKKYLPAATNKDIVIGVCGPPPMYKALSGPKNKDFTQGELQGALKDLGYTEEQVFKF